MSTGSQHVGCNQVAMDKAGRGRTQGVEGSDCVRQYRVNVREPHSAQLRTAQLVVPQELRVLFQRMRAGGEAAHRAAWESREGSGPGYRRERS
jgi:hypothetical protein